MKTALFIWCSGLLLMACGGAAPAPRTGEDTAVAQPAEDPAAGGQGALVIEERPLFQVALEAELYEKYQSMGLPDELGRLLAQTHVEFNIPDTFELAAFEDNPLWQYDCALKAKSGKVEIRFRVVKGELAPPEGVAGAEGMAPEKIIAMDLMNVLMTLNGANLVADMQTHPAEEARTRFNAEAYTTATFAPVPEFAPYEIGSAGVFYRQGLGKVIVISLLNGMNDPQSRTEWVTGANAMRFADQKGPQ